MVRKEGNMVSKLLTCVTRPPVAYQFCDIAKGGIPSTGYLTVRCARYNWKNAWGVDRGADSFRLLNRSRLCVPALLLNSFKGGTGLISWENVGYPEEEKRPGTESMEINGRVHTRK